jgi:hypothetical protein
LKTENEIFKRYGCDLNSPLDEKIAAIERLKKDFPPIRSQALTGTEKNSSG